METYKVYKTLQRSPRLFGMDRNIAMEFICTLTLSILLCFMILGSTVPAVIGVFICIAICLFLFKLRDRQNSIASFKKRRVNRKKPKTITSNPLKTIPVERIINTR